MAEFCNRMSAYYQNAEFEGETDACDILEAFDLAANKQINERARSDIYPLCMTLMDHYHFAYTVYDFTESRQKRYKTVLSVYKTVVFVCYFLVFPFFYIYIMFSQTFSLFSLSLELFFFLFLALSRSYCHGR